MAGRPKLLALKKRIAEDGIEDEIFEAIADGDTLQAICDRFGVSSRKMLYDWVGKAGALKEKFDVARKISADAHAEMAGQILDDVDSKLLTGPEVALAVGKMKYRQWIASVRDRDQYGAQTGPAIQLHFGDLHLAALQSPGARPQIAAARFPEIQEAEILSIEEAEDTSDGGEADAHASNLSGPIAPLVVPASASLAPELGELL